MMRLMGAMEIFTAQQQEDIKDEVRLIRVSPRTSALWRGGAAPLAVFFDRINHRRPTRVWLGVSSPLELGDFCPSPLRRDGERQGDTFSW